MANKLDVNEYTRAWNAKSEDRVVEFYADDAEIVALPNPEPYRGKEGVRKNMQDLFKGFDDLNVDVQWSVQEQDKAAILLRATGKHTGAFELAPGASLPATNKKLDVTVGIFVELDRNGKIRREIDVADSATMLMQLGAIDMQSLAGKPGRAIERERAR